MFRYAFNTPTQEHNHANLLIDKQQHQQINEKNTLVVSNGVFITN